MKGRALPKVVKPQYGSKYMMTERGKDILHGGRIDIDINLLLCKTYEHLIRNDVAHQLGRVVVVIRAEGLDV